MVIRMRHTRAHTRNRRSHHALKDGAIVVDKETGVPHLRHRASSTTGKYRGRQVIDVHAKIEKKAKKLKQKNIALGQEEKNEKNDSAEEKKLDPAKLSQK